MRTASLHPRRPADKAQRRRAEETLRRRRWPPQPGAPIR